MVKVIPAILTDDSSELRKLLQYAEGVTDRVQIDVIDAVFADNKTVDLEIFTHIETSLLLDFHLMVKEPKSWVEKCVRAGADRIIGHIEMMESQLDFVSKVQETGAKIGLALDLPTSPIALDSVALNNVDTILVMSVKAGFGGQEFDRKALAKIELLSEMRSRDGLSFSIMDDGGVSLENIKDLVKSGVDEVIVGKRLFDGDLKENIKLFTQVSGTTSM